MLVTSFGQISRLRTVVLQNLKKSKAAIEKIFEGENAIETLSIVKFKEAAFDPIKGTQLNFVEVLNQAFSDLVVLYAVEELLSRHPEQTFEIRLGAQSGHDIESKDGKIVGECFSVTKMNSNNKLKRDTEKLLLLGEDVHKYIFFYSDKDSDETIDRFTKKYPQITYVRVRSFE